MSSPIQNQKSEIRNRWTLVATILGSAMAFIDGSVVNVGLPAIQRSLGASVADMQWVVNAYTLLLGALILTGGSAGDRYGRRRIFVLGIALFTAASVWCGLAPDITQLVIARGMQGIGGALMVPSSLAIIGATYAKKERGRAIGTWAGFSAITTAIGPVLGGWLVDAFSWRLIFFVNVPLAIVTLAITFMKMRESRDEEATGGLDWVGALLATVGLGGIIYGLIEVTQRGWGDLHVVLPLIGGIVILVLFLLVERRHRAPMMPLDLFGSRTFSGANLLTLLLYFALGGAFFFLPFNLIQVQRYSAAQAGATFLPFTIIMGGLSRWSGGLIDRYGAKKPLVAGPAIVAVAYALFALPGIGGSYWTTFFPAIVVLGIGMTITVAPLTTAVLGAVSEHRSGVASGINNAVSRVTGALAVATMGIVAVSVFGSGLDSGLARLNLLPETRTAVETQRQKLAVAEPPAGLAPPERAAITRVIEESFVESFRVIMLIACGLSLASAGVAWLMIDARDAGPAERRKAISSGN